MAPVTRAGKSFTVPNTRIREIIVLPQATKTNTLFGSSRAETSPIAGQSRLLPHVHKCARGCVRISALDESRRDIHQYQWGRNKPAFNFLTAEVPVQSGKIMIFAISPFRDCLISKSQEAVACVHGDIPVSLPTKSPVQVLDRLLLRLLSFQRSKASFTYTKSNLGADARAAANLPEDGIGFTRASE